MSYNEQIYTIYEATPFARIWQDYWNEEEHGEFCRFLSENPEAGNVVPKSGGVRKVHTSVENIPAHILKKLKESIEHGDG